MKKNVVIIIVMLALLVVLALYVGRTPVEDFEAGTQELVVAETAVSHTITVDDHISLDGAVLFPFDSAVLSDDGKAIIDERIVEYRARFRIRSISMLLAMQTTSVPMTIIRPCRKSVHRPLPITSMHRRIFPTSR